MTATETRPVVRSQVEPRIVERRRTVLEAQRRRRQRRWIALGVAVATLLAAAGVLWSPLTDVDVIQLSGTESLDADALRDASGIVTGDQLVQVDLAAARDRLRDAPMVAAATVRREWPDTVRISVVEERPVLQLRNGETVHVVSSTGRVLPDGLDDVESLPVLDVPAVRLAVGEQVPGSLRPALVVHARMPEPLRPALSSGRLDQDGSMSFALPDEATIAFGPVEDVPAKLVAIQAFLDQVTMECLDVLDVRQPDRPTASRRAGCVPPAPTEVDGTAPDAADPDAGAVSDTTATTGPEGGAGQ